MGGPKGLAALRPFAILVAGEEKELPDLHIKKGDRVREGVDTSIFDNGIITLRKILTDASLYPKLLSPGPDSIHVPRGYTVDGLRLSVTCSSEVRYEHYDYR
jgi:hypothetical protein